MTRASGAPVPQAVEFPFGAEFANEIIDTVRQPLVVLGEDLRVERANRSFYRAFSLVSADTEGRRLPELSGGQWNVPALRELLRGVLEGGMVVEDFELERDFAGIGRRTLLLNARSIRRPASRVRALLLAIEDVTEPRAAEEAVRAHLRELTRSNAALDRFAYAASHDLQEPLRMVASFTDLLAQRYRGRLDGDADEFIHYITDGVARMQQLIDDILRYSRMSVRELELAPVDCGAVVDEAVARLCGTPAGADGSVTHEVLPVLRADPVLLGQLFQNLLGNALKFHGGAPALAHVSAVRRGDEWEFSVTDNGIGIALEHQERIFVLFQRLHGRAAYPGSGIGLALCRGIVERHGGRIWVESAPGQGASFRFTWPIGERTT